MTINPNTRSAAKLPDWLSPPGVCPLGGRGCRDGAALATGWYRTGTQDGASLVADTQGRGREDDGGKGMKAAEYMEQMRNAKSYASRTRIMLWASHDNELSFAGYMVIKNLYDRLNEGEVTTHV